LTGRRFHVEGEPAQDGVKPVAYGHALLGERQRRVGGDLAPDVVGDSDAELLDPRQQGFAQLAKRMPVGPNRSCSTLRGRR